MNNTTLIAAATLAGVALISAPGVLSAQGTGTPMSATTEQDSDPDNPAATMPKADDAEVAEETSEAKPVADTEMAEDASLTGEDGKTGTVQMAGAKGGAGMPLIRAEAVEDAKVYSLSAGYDETFWDSGEPFGPVMTAWDEVGSVEDLVLDNAAQVVGVTVDVGGFLGIGESTVLIPLDEMRLVQMPENEGFFVVTRMSQDQLEEAGEIENLVGDD